MKYGIIDIGSNTIRLTIYKCNNGTFKSLMNKKTVAGLGSYVNNQYMSADGIRKASMVLNGYRKLLSNLDIDNIYAFATASLRNVKNTVATVEEIFVNTGLSIDVISGEEEGRLDLLGATSGISMSDGLLLDIGGGSTEIVRTENNEIIDSTSIPIGSLNLYTKYVAGILPTPTEKKTIKQTITAELAKLDKLPIQKYQTICGVGGTIRAAKNIGNELFNLSSNNKDIDIANLRKLVKLLTAMEKPTLQKILQVVPERIHTLIPGVMILHMVTRRFACETIHVSKYGVREGYLIDRVLKKEAEAYAE